MEGEFFGFRKAGLALFVDLAAVFLGAWLCKTSFRNCLGRICPCKATINKQSTPNNTMCLQPPLPGSGKWNNDFFIIFMKIYALTISSGGRIGGQLFFNPSRILKCTILPGWINTNVCFLLFLDNPFIQKLLFFLCFVISLQHLVIVR